MVANKLPRKRSVPYQGLLAIGDPHLESRQPGFRCDDYSTTVLNKLRWCLNYAIENNLLPMLLGDLFDKPRDNPNWMLTQLIGMMQSIEVVGIFGNHDCADTTLNENDSLYVLVQSGCLKLVSADQPWVGEVNGRQVMVGGSSYRAPVPEKVELPKRTNLFHEDPLVVWLTHHDVLMKGYDNVGRFSPFEIENVDLLINGHIHRRLDPVQRGKTRWITPGNISRRSRSEANKNHTPSVLRIDVLPDQHRLTCVEVPHEPADKVFHEAVIINEVNSAKLQFVDGLKELKMRRTDTGAGLHQFLEQNLSQFDTVVADEIRALALQVTQEHGENQDG